MLNFSWDSSVSYTMFQGLRVAEISKGVMNGKSPCDREIGLPLCSAKNDRQCRSGSPYTTSPLGGVRRSV